jgi:hypothetical protein
MARRIEQQREKLPLLNFDLFTGGGGGEGNVRRRRHSALLPDSIRCITCGPSNSGKTNAIFNLLFAKNGLKFENIYVFSKSLYQPKYRFLEEIMSKVPEIGFYTFTDNEAVVHPSDAKPNSVMIFDDVACEKQHNIRNYFAMGRHNCIDVFYLSQTYSTIPKQLVRDNCNLIVVFRQDERNLRHIFYDHISPDLSFDQFKKMCAECWSDRAYGFLVIDKESEAGRYRLGFDKFIKGGGEVV